MRHVLALLFHDVYDHSPSESGIPGPAANRYKLARADFDAQIAGLRESRSDSPILVAQPGTHEDTGRLPFVVTVDDGGLSYYTIVAERLEGLGWRGHCLVTTSFIGRHGFLTAQHIRELHARGHVIGSHSVSHPRRLSVCPWEAMVREWRDSREALADVVGADVAAASVPGGYFSRRVALAAREAGLRFLFTSEPDTRVWDYLGCAVMGRFTLRRGHRPDFARRLAASDAVVRWREWLGWNAKKPLKVLLGDVYARLAVQRGHLG